MKMRTDLFVLSMVVTALATSTSAGAADLQETFRLALTRDQVYLGALASHDASQELIPQARAQLLPSASFSASRMQNKLDKNEGGGALPTQQYNSNNRIVAVRQPVWRPIARAQLEQAKSQTRGANYDLLRAQNELALRTATVYMDALYAEDQRKVAQTQVQQLRAQLEAATLAFRQGYGTRIDIDEFYARLGQAEADVMQHQSSRAYALEQLSLFAGVSQTLPLAQTPTALAQLPNLPHWLDLALQDNPDTNLGRMKVEAAQQEVRKVKAGHQPTLDVVAQISNSSNENIQFPAVSHVNRQIGLQLNLPLFSGGATQSSVRQALSQAQREEHLLNSTLANTRLQITREFANVGDGRERINANLNAHRAAQQTLVAMEKSLQAGYRTRLDVLNAIQRVAATQKDLLLVQYQTLIAWLKLQLQSGVPAEKAMASLVME